MNWNPTQPPKSAIAPRLARTSEPERRMPSRTSGVAVLARATTNAVSRIAAPANDSERAR